MSLSLAIAWGRNRELGELPRIVAFAAAVALALAGPAGSSVAQLRSIDPNAAIDRDLSTGNAPRQQDPTAVPGPGYGEPVPSELPPDRPASPSPAPAPQLTGAGATAADGTYQRKDVFNAAEKVFGRGAEGLGNILERILKDQGEPRAYIAGREASGAFILGLRYGSGVMSHRVEGDMPVYWTGPSVGFDAGGNASKVFVLV